MVDYRIGFARPGGKRAEKVFKLKAAEIKAGVPLTLRKAHLLKGDATTFTLHPGTHEVVLQVNGVDVARASFDLIAIVRHPRRSACGDAARLIAEPE